MYKAHPCFLPPENENVKIWRYLDIPRFLWLIERKSLYFSRCDLLGDPFEGSLPSSPNQIIPRYIGNVEIWKGKSPLAMWRELCYICSFHMNDFESAALWSIYSKSNQGVAIQLTYKRLIKSLEDYPEDVQIGTVKYIDYRSDVIEFGNSFLPILHKRKSFEHEKEIRAVILPINELSNRISDDCREIKPVLPEGVNIPIDLGRSIERIYLAPTTKPWIKELLQSIMDKNGIDIPLEQSSLDANPII